MNRDLELGYAVVVIFLMIVSVVIWTRYGIWFPFIVIFSFVSLILLVEWTES